VILSVVIYLLHDDVAGGPITYVQSSTSNL